MIFDPPDNNQSVSDKDIEKNAIREEILDEIADLEEYASRGVAPPHCRGYRIRINGERYEVHKPVITGFEVLEIAKLSPPKDYTLRVKMSGQPPRKIELKDPIDLRAPGVEKFKATPREQTEG